MISNDRLELLKTELDNCKILEENTVAYVNNWEKYYNKEEERLLSFLQKRKEEEDKTFSLQKQIERSKEIVATTRQLIEECNSELSKTQTEISVREAEKENLTVQYEHLFHRRKMMNSRIESAANSLKRRLEEIESKLSLYRMYLRSELTYECPNVYKYSFVSENMPQRWIKFQFNESTKNWSVLECEPSNLIKNDVWTFFRNNQDTQYLLSSIHLGSQ